MSEQEQCRICRTRRGWIKTSIGWLCAKCDALWTEMS